MAARLPSLKTALIALVAYVVALIFLLPYLEMLITSVRPQRELFDRDYLPRHFAWSNLTNMWGWAMNLPGGTHSDYELDDVQVYQQVVTIDDYESGGTPASMSTTAAPCEYPPSTSFVEGHCCDIIAMRLVAS